MPRHRLQDARNTAGWHAYMSGWTLNRYWVGKVSFKLPQQQLPDLITRANGWLPQMAHR